MINLEKRYYIGETNPKKREDITYILKKGLAKDKNDQNRCLRNLVELFLISILFVEINFDGYKDIERFIRNIL